MESIFKAYDIRGKVGSELTGEVAMQVGQAFGAWLPEAGTVAVGRDMRPDSEELANALVSGLREIGRDVVDIGLITSDMLYFAVGEFGYAGGAVVTASHNPGEYNGIKFCREQARGISIETGLAEIRDLALGGLKTMKAEEGSLAEKDVLDDWVEHVKSFADISAIKPFKVAIDAGNGMAGKVLPVFEAALPLKVTPMFYELDGTFPNHPANPLIVENLSDLAQEITDNNLDFGFAFDGDGDRAFFVDEQGKQVEGTTLTAILARHFLSKQAGATVLYNATVGQAVPNIVEKLGGQSVRTKVGHSFIKNDMRTHDALFAGESSGHYYFRDNFYADSGLIAVIVALQVISEANKPLSQLVSEVDPYFRTPETNFEVKDKQATMDKIEQEYAQSGEADWLDGLTLNFGTSWVNVRPSNTEPLLRLNIEAKTKDRLDELEEQLRSLLSS